MDRVSAADTLTRPGVGCEVPDSTSGESISFVLPFMQAQGRVVRGGGGQSQSDPHFFWPGLSAKLPQSSLNYKHIATRVFDRVIKILERTA
jgi:hypothetical protein